MPLAAKKFSDLTSSSSPTGTMEVPLYDPDGATPALKNLRAPLSELAEYVESTITIPDAGIANVVEDTSPQLGGALDANGQQIREAKGADVASIAALVLGNDGNYFDITGTTAITSIGTKGVGTRVTLHFDAALVLTHHASNLILPTGANITTAAGDEATFREYATGQWRCVSYLRADGTALAGVPGSGITDVVLDTTPQLGGVLDANGKQIREAKGADVASATALPILGDGNYFSVTGTTTITSIATMGVGTRVSLRFAGVLVLTHHATDLILPTGANITTAAGDVAVFREYAAGDWVCESYQRASGAPLANMGNAGVPTSFGSTDVSLTLQTENSGLLMTIDATMGDLTFTIDPQSSMAYTTGTNFWIQKTAGNATVVRGSGVQLYYQGTNGDLTLATNTTYHIWRQAEDIWRVIGQV